MSGINFETFRNELLVRLDKNQNGQIDREEFPTYADDNNDCYISGGEFSKLEFAVTKDFAAYRLSNNGQLSNFKMQQKANRIVISTVASLYDTFYTIWPSSVITPNRSNNTVSTGITFSPIEELGAGIYLRATLIR